VRLAYRLVIGVLLLALLAGVFLIGGRSDTTENDDARAGADAGYAARDTEVIETGTDGRELYRLKAELIRQRPDAGIVELERVRMDYYPGARTDEVTSPAAPAAAATTDAPRALWKVTAQRGEVQESGDSIRLSGDVNVAGPMPTAAETIQLDTDALVITPREERITTDALVTLTWSGQRLSAVGMIANLKDETVQLQSKVNGRFIP